MDPNGPAGQWQPWQQQPPQQPPPPHPEGVQAPTTGTRRRLSWTTWVLPLVALVVGIGGGIALGHSDPTSSDEYRDLKQVAADRRDDLIEAETEGRRAVREAESEARRTVAEAEAAMEGRAAELDQRESDLVAREQAVTAVEQRIAATSIGQGIWTVGIDIEPGTYRVSEALTGYCYWSITASGTNGDDIIENDGPEGGFPTVTLSVGQDFENSGCGTFVKQ